MKTAHIFTFAITGNEQHVTAKSAILVHRFLNSITHGFSLNFTRFFYPKFLQPLLCLYIVTADTAPKEDKETESGHT